MPHFRNTRSRRGSAARNLVLIIAGLAVGVGIGAAAFRQAEAPPAPALPAASAVKAEAGNQAAEQLETENTQLKARLQELDQAVADRDRIITRLRADVRETTDKPATETAGTGQPQTDGRTDRGPRGGFDRGNMPKSMAELKEKDPEAYAQMRERIEGFTTRMQSAMLKQGDFFGTLDAKLMTDEQRENHVKLQESLLAIQTNIEKMQNGELENADTWEMRREMMGALRDVGPMLDLERSAALSQLGQQLGYKQDAERQQFVEYVDHVYEMTSSGTLWKSMMGDRGPGGGPGGAPGGAPGGDRTRGAAPVEVK